MTVLESDKVTCAQCNHHCLPPKKADGYGQCVCYTGYVYKDNACQGTVIVNYKLLPA